METKIRTIEVSGYGVEVHKFSYGWFFYPDFNGNAEFKVTSKGYRNLSRYLRTRTYLNELMRNNE